METGWIILEWDTPHLRGIKFRQTAEGIILEASTSITLPAKTTPEQSIPVAVDSLKASELLTDHFGNSTSTTDASVAWQLGILIPRDRCTLRQLRFPAAIPAEELPAIVPLQLATELATSVDQLAIDFLPSSETKEETQQVWAVALPQQQMQQFRQLATKLQTELKWVGMSSFVWPAMINDMIPLEFRKDRTVLAWGNEQRLEMVALRNRQPLAISHRRRITDGPLNLKELVAEYRKLGLPTVDEDSATLSILLIDGTNAEHTTNAQTQLTDELSTRTSCPVYCFAMQAEQSELSWLKTSDGKSKLTSELMPLLAVGRMLSGNQTDQLNLQSPKKVKPPQDRRKLYYGLVSAAAVCLLGIAFGWWWLKLSALDNEILTLNTQLADTRKFNKENSEKQKQADTLLEIRSRHLQLQAHSAELMATLPDRSQLLLKSWSAIPISGKAHTKVNVQGICRTRQLAEQLADKLDRAGLLVRTPVIRPSEIEGPYPYEFELEYEIPIATDSSTAAVTDNKTRKK